MIEDSVGKIKFMASVSGRDFVNIFDFKAILSSHYSTRELISFIQKTHPVSFETFKGEIGSPQGVVKVNKKPPEYTYKNTKVKAFRPEDPVAVQKSITQQRHCVEALIRKRLSTFYPNDVKFVNFEK